LVNWQWLSASSLTSSGITSFGSTVPEKATREVDVVVALLADVGLRGQLASWRLAVATLALAVRA
jgi:hypothetical protein